MRVMTLCCQWYGEHRLFARHDDGEFTIILTELSTVNLTESHWTSLLSCKQNMYRLSVICNSREFWLPGIVYSAYCGVFWLPRIPTEQNSARVFLPSVILFSDGISPACVPPSIPSFIYPHFPQSLSSYILISNHPATSEGQILLRRML